MRFIPPFFIEFNRITVAFLRRNCVRLARLREVNSRRRTRCSLNCSVLRLNDCLVVVRAVATVCALLVYELVNSRRRTRCSLNCSVLRLNDCLVVVRAVATLCALLVYELVNSRRCTRCSLSCSVLRLNDDLFVSSVGKPAPALTCLLEHSSVGLRKFTP